jgi:hypothetical protein
MPGSAQALADRLTTEGSRVVEFFNQLNHEQWGVLVYPGQSGWNMHQLLAHFVSAEIGRKELIVNVYNGGEGAPGHFEIDSFNQAEVERLSLESAHDLLRRFTQERAMLVELVSSMPEQGLERTGNDPYLGEVSLVEMIKLTYRHLQIHLRDARRCL